MSNNWDHSPEFDYNELRRQREEYKQRKRMAQQDVQPAEEGSAPAQPEVFAPAEAKKEQPAPQPERDSFEEAIEEGYEDYADDYADEAEDIDAANPNPFDSFISFFHGVKSSVSKRHGKGEDDQADELDDLTEEELAMLEGQEGDVRPARRGLRRNAQPEEAEDAPAGEAVDIDIPSVETGFSEGAAYSDEDFDDEDYDEEDIPRKSGFKRFMNLFVTRVEDEEDDYDEEDYEDYEEADVEDDEDADDSQDEYQEEQPKRRGFFGRKARRDPREDDYHGYFDESLEEMRPVEPKGEDKMDDLNNAAPAQAPAAQPSGMTRRERRELAMRLAAEEEARKAQEESAPAEIVPAAAEEKVDMAAFQNAPADTEVIVETTAREAEEKEAVEDIVEEPTREFKPVTLRDVQESAGQDLFDLDADDEDEEEIVEKKPRFSLFGKKRAKVEDEDEDEDDYDDDDGNEDDEDEDEEIVEKPRRGLFGRKRARIEEEDEDDEDEDDDYDDDDYDEYEDDEDDEYDAYDDDEDDEDEDDYDDEDEYDYDDEPRRSFGHHLLGVIKTILAIILVLLVVICGFNFHYYLTGENAVISKAHEIMGDSAAFDLFCFSYDMRRNMVVEEEIVEEILIEAEATPVPTAVPTAEPAIEVPSLDGSAVEAEVQDIVETQPVVDAAPAVEAAPAAAGSVG